MTKTTNKYEVCSIILGRDVLESREASLASALACALRLKVTSGCVRGPASVRWSSLEQLQELAS